jgi:UDP-N-acetylmuramoylalanine--D-glutamate ligase
MRIQDLAGKRVAVYGLGREGRSVLRVLAETLPGQALTVINDSPLSEEDQAWLAHFPAARFLIGQAARLGDFEVLIKSPGISAYKPEIQAARAGGTLITSATRLWFAEHPQAKTVCVTGTKGKSTSASLIAHLLRHAGYNAALGGNIGMPLFDIEEAAEIWVLELSSYQASDFDASPTVSVLLNLFPEHTDWHGAVETYYRDKLNLLTCPQNRGIKLVNFLDPNTAGYLPALDNLTYFNHPDGLHVADGEILNAGEKLWPCAQVPLPGAHNLSNVCAALSAIAALGVDLMPCLPGLADFRALPHRLRLLGEQNGVRYVDDSISTTPQSALAAVSAFAGAPLTLLLGGYERHLDWQATAVALMRGAVQEIILMGASGPRIAEALESARAGHGGPRLSRVTGLGEAVSLAQALTPPGGVVLLSPGAPSYGEFKNFQERGAAFAALAGFAPAQSSVSR